VEANGTGWSIARGAGRATFIVRLTRAGPASWRGDVEYVQQGERRPAASWAGAAAQLALWLAEADARAATLQGGEAEPAV
jgi:hypothetical protein